MPEAPQEVEPCWTCGGDWDECQHGSESCDRAPDGSVCIRAAGHDEGCALIALGAIRKSGDVSNDSGQQPSKQDSPSSSQEPR